MYNVEFAVKDPVMTETENPSTNLVPVAFNGAIEVQCDAVLLKEDTVENNKQDRSIYPL
jgi:hypothetical protein